MHILTGIDGESFDVGRVLWVLGVLAFVGYAGYDLIVNKQPFNPQNYGIGLGGALAGGGLGIGMKAKTEPQS